MNNRPVTIEDVKAMDAQDLTALQRQAARNLVNFVLIKVAIAVTCRYAVKALVRHLDSLD